MTTEDELQLRRYAEVALARPDLRTIEYEAQGKPFGFVFGPDEAVKEQKRRESKERP